MGSVSSALWAEKENQVANLEFFAVLSYIDSSNRKSYFSFFDSDYTSFSLTAPLEFTQKRSGIHNFDVILV